MAEIALPHPLSHQEAPLADPARIKLWNWGRRTGKSRGSFIAAVAGHGPGSTWGAKHAPAFPGIMQGVDVVWFARDYPQATTIWQEEIRPRFAGVQGVEINQQLRQVRIAGAGMLEVRSAEAIDGFRGRGGNLGGVILDEAAHWHLEYAWRAVILPALLDNNGWAILNSSPNAGHDGNPDHRVPSYFNMLCQQVMDGHRPGWSYSHQTAEQNPRISPDAFQALVSEYPADSPQLAEEVYAKLLTSGAGLAFPEINPAIHTIKALGPIDQYRWFGGLDWGYRSPGCFLLLAAGPDNEVNARWEYYFREQTPVDVGRTLGRAFMQSHLTIPEWIAGDQAMWGVHDGVSIAERVQQGLRDVLNVRAPALVATPKGPQSRQTGWQLIHEGLKYDPANVQDGVLAPYHRPRLRFHPDCQNLWRTLPTLPRDEKDPEDVNTDAEDHAADALRYALVLRQPHVERAHVPTRGQDQHPGWHPDGTPKRPQIPGYDEEHARVLAEQAGSGFRTGMRWESE